MEKQLTPNFCKILWKDTNETEEVTIVTYGHYEEGSAEDEQTFFYCSDINELRSLMDYDNGEDFVVLTIGGYTKKAFDCQCKPFAIKGAPDYFSIARGDYEGLPCPMKAWNWSDEDMQRLADNIGMRFGYEYLVSNGCDEDVISEEYWRAMEGCAVDMGMLYYEDMTEDEFEADQKAYQDYING